MVPMPYFGAFAKLDLNQMYVQTIQNLKKYCETNEGQLAETIQKWTEVKKNT